MAYTGSVDLISGIRPKNNGSFPLVDAKDVYVSDDKRLDAALDEKADAVDTIAKPAEEGTTGQILRIDEEGKPAWSNVGTPTEEQVGDAVDAWLTAHPEATTTVQDGSITRAKLDADLQQKTDEVSELKSAIAFDETLYAPDGIVDKNNLILGRGMIGRGRYFYGSETVSPDYFYIAVPVVSGESYTFLYIRFISSEDEGLVNNTGYNTPQTWTATLTGNVFLSIKYENIKNAYFCKTADYTASDFGTGETPLFNAATLAQSAGQSTKKPISQKLLADSLANAANETEAKLEELASEFRSALGMIETPQIVGMTSTGKTVQSVNLFDHAELVGAGKAIYSIANGKVVLADSEDYNTYLLHVDGASTYTFTNCRSAVVVSDLEYTAVSQLLTYVTDINSTGGEYIIFCFNPTTYPESAYSVTKPVGVYTIPSNWSLSGIEIQTPQINGMLPTGRNVKSSNLFSKAVNVGTGKYVDRIQNGKAVLSDNADYDTYLIPVDGSSVYSFTNCRTAAVVSDLQYTAVGALLSNTTSIDSTGGSYILFSFKPATYPVNAYSVTKPVPQYTVPADWAFNDGAKQRYQIKAGSIASGGALSLSGKTAVKYGQRIAFKGFITAFSEITLAYYNYNNSAISNSIVVNGTSMIVYVGSSAVDTFTHGLTIANDISLIVDYLVTGVEITLESNGAKYKAQTTWERLTSGVVSAAVKSNGTVCTSAMLVMAIERVEKPIWYFGDSYISYTNQARWPYYLIQYNFDGNTLLNGYAGGTSAADMMAFEALLNYGTPKFAVFATGMNDNASTGGDTSSEAAPAWVSARDNFIALCDANGITPIFCTVPTVPSVNNQKKNEWIRSSGYRYIDFAKAVGANADGEWYGNGTANDMLSSDKVHPTERGAVALFTQAITDFPEFLT